MNSLSVVFAHDDNFGIGKDNTLPWHLSSELKWFSSLTKGKNKERAGKHNVVIMGKNTFLSLPEDFKPLPGRINIVLSRDPIKTSTIISSAYTNEQLSRIVDAPGVYVRESLDDALKWCENNSHIVYDVFVIGGAQLISEAIPRIRTDYVYVTHVSGDFNCDIKMCDVTMNYIYDDLYACEQRGVDHDAHKYVTTKYQVNLPEGDTVENEGMKMAFRKAEKLISESKARSNASRWDALEKLGEELEVGLEDSAVDHPAHYSPGVYEAIKVIEAWDLGFCLGNTVKYVARAGKKDPTKEIEDLEKAKWYLERHIQYLKQK